MTADPARVARRGAGPGAREAAAVGVTVLLLGVGAALGSPVGLGIVVGLAGVMGLVMVPWVGAALVASAMLGEGLVDLGIRVAGIPLTGSKLMVAVVSGSWFLHAALTRRPFVATTPVTAGLVAVLVAMLVSIALGHPGRFVLQDVSTLVLNGVMVSVFYAMFESVDLDKVFRAFAAVTTVVLVGSVIQGLSEVRAAAAWGDPNDWAAIAILIGHVALGVFVRAERGSRTDLATTALLFLYLVAVYQTHSRAGLLAATVMLPFTLVGIRWERRTMVFAVAGLALAGPLIVTNLEATWLRFEAILSQEWGRGPKEQIDARVIMLGVAWQAFLSSPIHGIGLSKLQDEAAYLFPSRGGKDTHNSYAQILGEQGLIGAAAHLFLAWQVGRAMVQAYRTEDPRQRTLSWYLACGMTGFALMQLTSGRLMVSPIAYFVLTLMLAHARRVGPPLRSPAASPR